VDSGCQPHHLVYLARQTRSDSPRSGMNRFHRGLLVVTLIAFCLPALRGQEDKEGGGSKKNKIEYPSPDGHFAFRYSGDPDLVGSVEDTGDKQTYDLIDKKSGKKLMTVVESDEDIGPSARFNMTVLWQPNSKAFAISAYLWKRGTTLFVYRQEGAKFRSIDIPELDVDVPAKEKKGKEFPHVSEMNSATAQRWQPDGSLQVEVESMYDGEDSTITATRKVTLGFNRSSKAKILKSSVKYVTEKQ
jgi:hypothetical protein